MLKLFVLWLLVQPLGSHVPEPAVSTVSFCACAAITNLHTASKSAGAINLAWTGHSGATGYKVYYLRHADNYTSNQVNVIGGAYSYSGLPAGTYTFYVAAVCNGVQSGFIGMEDEVLN